MNTRETKKIKFAGMTLIRGMQALLTAYAHGEAQKVSAMLAEFRPVDFCSALAEAHGMDFDSSMLLNSKHDDNMLVQYGKRMQALAQAVRACIVCDVLTDGMPLQRLTGTENLILALHNAGRANKAKAEILGMSIRTVEFHCANIKKKNFGSYPSSSLTAHVEYRMRVDKQIELELRELVHKLTD